MARIRVEHDLKRLVADYSSMPAQVVRKGHRAVDLTQREGTAAARRFAQELSGPHGKNYFKRITGEMVAPLVGEFGPHAGGTPVGGGWRHGAPNTELERAQDIAGPALARRTRALLDELPWQ